MSIFCEKIKQNEHKMGKFCRKLQFGTSNGAQDWNVPWLSQWVRDEDHEADDFGWDGGKLRNKESKK